MDEYGYTRSMSKKGCSPDNSACEGFFGRMKNEMFYGRSFVGVTIYLSSTVNPIIYLSSTVNPIIKILLALTFF